MAIKKKTKRRFAVKKTVAKPKVNEGFFQRMKEIIKSEMPQPEKVRVKTFIVEKPVIIHDKESSYVSDDSVFDSKKSRYSRNSIATGMGLVKPKKRIIKEEDLDEPLGDDLSSEDESLSESDSMGEEDSIEQESSDDSDLGEEGSIEGDEFGEEAPLESPSQTHTRSRGMFNNVWWKKALFWAILVWLLILAISMAMQAMKLIMVDLTRQWWVLLGIMILIEMIYFKFLDGKFNF